MSRKHEKKVRDDVPRGPVTPGSTLHQALQHVARAVAETLSASGRATTTAARQPQRTTKSKSPRRP